jgi:alanine racemase
MNLPVASPSLVFAQMTQNLLSPPRAWAEIDLSALRRNLAVARECGGAEVMAVVKASAYGHGLETVAKFFADEGVAFLGVANVGEARRICDAGIEGRIYLLGATWEAEREEIVARDWTPCLSTVDEADHFNQLAGASGRKLKVHLAIDSGMGRGGFLTQEMPEVMPLLERMQHLDIEGIGSHLPSADEDEDFTKGQIRDFRNLIESLGGSRRFKWRHLLNSAGLLGYDSDLCNLTRPGLMLYGASPLAGHQSKLSTVMRLKSRVTLSRWLPAGHGISYGREYVTSQATKVATVGIGYGDGYPRHLSGKGAEVFVGGRRCPILGRVTMDQIMIDVSDVPEVKEGDEVELFGPHISVIEVAEKAGTIAWEIFTGITTRVTRQYI